MRMWCAAPFLQVHNELTKRKKSRLTGQDILVLAPICLQKADCRYKISVGGKQLSPLRDDAPSAGSLPCRMNRFPVSCDHRRN